MSVTDDNIRKFRGKVRFSDKNKEHYQNILRSVCDRIGCDFCYTVVDGYKTSNRHWELKLVIFKKSKFGFVIGSETAMSENVIVYTSKIYGNPMNAICEFLNYYNKNIDKSVYC